MSKGCIVEGCHRPHQARGWCAQHYQSPRRCEVDGCDRPHAARGLCRRHYQSPRRCEVDGCQRPVKARDRCHRHYIRPGQRQTCTWSNCDRLVAHGGLCAMHYLRRRRGHRMDGPPQKRRWTPAEDRRIIRELVAKPWGQRDWIAVARELDRTRASCMSRVWVLRQRDPELLLKTG